MGRVKVKLNHHGMAELLSSAAVEADLLARGERVKSAGQASAPRETGDYADNIIVYAEKHKDRVVVKIGSTSDHASAVESNTGNMARALDAGL